MKTRMRISENECFRQDIKADQRQRFFFACFSACFRAHQTNTLVLEEKMKTTPHRLFSMKIDQ
jgi:hypothetical protein